jgi:hypothetical protein
VEGSFQHWNIKTATNTKTNRNVPSRIAAFELIQEPKRLLRNGCRETAMLFAQGPDAFEHG